MRKIKAVLFDMDGLMFDTERLAVRFWREAGEDFGIRLGDEFLIYSRGSRKEESEKLFHRCYGPDADYMGVRAREKELFFGYLENHEVPVKPGLFKLLSWLKEKDYRIVLATSTIRETAVRYLESTGAAPYFDGMVCGDMISRSKPDPEVFEKAGSLVGCRPEECAVLEDSLNGIKAAVDGGFTAIMVPDLAEPPEDLERQLHAKCRSLDEVIGVLEALETE